VLIDDGEYRVAGGHDGLLLAAAPGEAPVAGAQEDLRAPVGEYDARQRASQPGVALAAALGLGLSGRLVTEPPPRPVSSADDVPALPPRWLHGSEGDTGRFPRSSRSRSTSEASSSTLAASPRLHRRSSPWPPGRLSHRDQKFPNPAQRRRVRTATSPYPPDLSWWAVKGRQTLISRVHLLVSLTGPASSGSADTSRRCQGCSHPPQHLPDQAVNGN
jgi:hypothetical protein